jgi:hypothetical protein
VTVKTDPACWSFLVTKTVRDLVKEHDDDNYTPHHIFEAFQGDYCAMCKGCNTLEGFADEDNERVAKYRERPPAVMIGLRAVYTDQYGNTPMRHALSLEEIAFMNSHNPVSGILRKVLDDAIHEAARKSPAMASLRALRRPEPAALHVD